jgi:hypothetical protein
MSLIKYLKVLVQRRSQEASLPLSYFDLFVHGLVNIGRSLYYGMALVCDVAEAHLALNGSEFGLGMGANEHDFLFGYVQFLVEQHLAEIDVSDVLIDWYDRGIHPMLIAPLTSRGRELVRAIDDVQDRLVKSGQLTVPELINVAQEGLLRLELVGGHLLRIPVIQDFQTLVRREMQAGANCPAEPSAAPDPAT